MLYTYKKSMSTSENSENIKTEVFVLFAKAKELYKERQENFTFLDNKEEILKFETDNGLKLLPELKEWLHVFNLSEKSQIFTSTPILYDAKQIQESFDIGKDIYREYGWVQKNWIPIASDGCGNLYILGQIKPEIKEIPVFFMDMISSAPEPDYVVASDLWHFLKFVFMKSIHEFSSPERMFFWPLENLEEALKIDKSLKNYL